MGGAGEVGDCCLDHIEAELEIGNAAAYCVILAYHTVQECGDELEGAGLIRLILQKEGNLGVDG